MPDDAVNDMVKLFQDQGLDEDTAFLYAVAMTDPKFSKDPARQGAQNVLSHSLGNRYTTDKPVDIGKRRMVMHASPDAPAMPVMLDGPSSTNISRSRVVRVPKDVKVPIKYTPDQLERIAARKAAEAPNPLDPASLGKPVIGSGWPGSSEWPTVPYAVDAQHKKMVGDREKASATKMLQEYVMAQDKLRAAEVAKKVHTSHNAYLAAQGNQMYAAQNPLTDNPNPWAGTSPDQYLRDVGLGPVQVFASPGPRK